MAKTSDAVVGRARRPSWREPRLLVGLILIAVSVAAVVSIVQHADETDPYYAAARDLAPGTVLTGADLEVVHVRVGAGEYVQTTDAVVGQVLDRTVGKGELIPASSLVDAASFQARAIAVVSSMPLADGVGVGSTVDLWLTEQGDAGPHSTLVGSGLAVTDVHDAKSTLGGGGGQTVYIAVPLADVPKVLDAIATKGDIAIVAARS